MNIVLIGMRGSGKTTVAKILAEKLKKNYIEMDDLIINKAGASIPEIVEKYGWNYFRDLETEVTHEIANKDNYIISTGGGIVTKPENIKALKQNGRIFWLQVAVGTLLNRIGNDSNRPSLADKKSRKADMEEILKQRCQQYLEASDEIINTENISAQQVADKIMLKLKK